jgi:hypothetical protein
VKIFFSGQNSRLDAKADDLSSPASIATRLGHTIAYGVDEEIDVAICVDFIARDAQLLRKLKRKGVPIALIKQEPVVTSPAHLEMNPSNLFDLVITRGDPNSEPIFNTFQEWDIRFHGESHRLDRVVAINANKWSAIPGELYSLRRLCYSNDSRVDLYGRGWEEGTGATLVRLIKEAFIALRFRVKPELLNMRHAFHKPANYLGAAADKMGTLSKYKVSLVIENCSSYMSEKLVDAILAGCIPVYVGANPERFGIPKELYIQASPDVWSVRQGIELAMQIPHDEYLRRVKTWIDLPKTKMAWEAVQVFDAILRHIESELLN